MKCPPIPNSCESVSQEFEAFLKRCNEQQLLAQLRALQILLGTPAERPTDLAQARAIAHRLNNLATASILARQLKELDESGSGLP